MMKSWAFRAATATATVAMTFAGLFSAFGCAHSKIPHTTIDDTEDNRTILALVEEYQHAIEHRDAHAVLALVSPQFYEDNGNTDNKDDYDYEGLKESLAKDFIRTKSMQLQVRVDDVHVDEEAAYAELYFTFRAQNEYPSGLQWETGSDRTRLRFARSGDRWLIIAGL